MEEINILESMNQNHNCIYFGDHLIDKKFVKGLRVGLYARVSTIEQTLGYSINAQKTEGYHFLMDICEVPQCHIKEYIDDGKSGGSLNRPAVIDLLHDIENGQLNAVVVWKFDRLTRDVIDTYKIIDFMKEHDCIIHSLVGKVDASNAVGRMQLGVESTMYQYEREISKERSENSLKQMCRNGLFPYGYTPFGCKKIDKKLYIDEESSKVLLWMFNQAESGVTCTEMESKLFQEFGIKKRGDAIRRILDRSYYTGEFEYKDRVYENVVPQFISKERYGLVKKSLKKRLPSLSRGKYYYGNSVRCVCGEICVKSLTKRPTKRIYYYYCPKCNKRINQNDLLKMTLLYIMTHAKHMKLNEKEKKIKTRLDKIQSKLSNICDEYVSDRISEKAYALATNKLEKEQKNLQAELTALDIKCSSKWQELNDLERNKYITTYIKYVIVDTELKVVNKIVYK